MKVVVPHCTSLYYTTTYRIVCLFGSLFVIYCTICLLTPISTMSAEPFSGSISNAKKAYLFKIAKALDIDSSSTLKDLRPQIKSCLNSKEDNLSKDSYFQGLYHYCSSATADRSTEKVKKTSADKNAKHMLQTQMPAQDPTP